MDILDRISLLLGDKEQKELTKHLGLNSVAFSEWKSGKSKSYRKYLIEIAEFFNVSIDFLVYGKDSTSSLKLSDNEQDLLESFNKLNTINKGKVIGTAKTLASIEEEQRIKESKLIEQHINSVYIDFYNVPVSAGTGIFLNSDDKESLHVKASPEVDQADFCLRISGDSMEPDYTDGEIILIKSCPTVDIGEIGIFIVNNKTYIKKLGKNRLISLNPNYKDISLQENDSVYCMGKVVGALEDDDILD